MKKVMVIEDSETTRVAIGLILNQKNYWVKLCANVEQAMASIIGGIVPDIILADFFLPDGTGIDFIEFLRTLPMCKNTKCILSTAASAIYMEDLREKINALDIVLVFKPWEPANMVEMVRRLAMTPTTTDGPKDNTQQEN